jgi:8-oxo-dGTP pyrophosphatase MutT (NUDIX family)
MSVPRKACPVVVRELAGRKEVLAFHHPSAGCQLVKGTIELPESIPDAAERELLEESGLVGTASDYIGALQMNDPEQEWHFVVCRVGPLPDAWTHRTCDGGGLDFEFFWYPLDHELDDNWHPIFKRALVFISRHIDPLVQFRS